MLCVLWHEPFPVRYVMHIHIICYTCLYQRTICIVQGIPVRYAMYILYTQCVSVREISRSPVDQQRLPHQAYVEQQLLCLLALFRMTPLPVRYRLYTFGVSYSEG